MSPQGEIRSHSLVYVVTAGQIQTPDFTACRGHATSAPRTELHVKLAATDCSGTGGCFEGRRDSLV